MEYDPEILYIYSHGYFSPLEREFLKKLQRVIEGKDVEVFHSGDMDYGGIRILNISRSIFFPGIKPLQMDVETYEKYEEYAENDLERDDGKAGKGKCSAFGGVKRKAS